MIADERVEFLFGRRALPALFPPIRQPRDLNLGEGDRPAFGINRAAKPAVAKENQGPANQEMRDGFAH